MKNIEVSCKMSTPIPGVAILEKNKDISKELLLPNGKLNIFKYKDYEKYSFEDLRAFCHFYGRYGIPTFELINLLVALVGNRSAIEIGAGHGDLGFHFGIPMTDSKMQSKPHIKAFYQGMGQPSINYPDDVEELEAIDAIKKYKPKVVIASWVTTYSKNQEIYGSCPYGVKENEILDLVDTYILIGCHSYHGDKPIMKLPHDEIYEPFILSRVKDQSQNRIYSWNGKGTICK